MTRLSKADSGLVSDIGDQVRARRERLGMDKVDLAREAGVSRDTLAAIEAGLGFRHSSLAKIYKALEDAEAEAGYDAKPLPLALVAEVDDVMEFRVEGNFGVSVVVRGPVRDAAQLEESVARLIRKMGND